MTALEEIRGRLETANAEMDRLTAGNPGTNWRWSIPADPERDSDLILAAALADNARLLADLQNVLNLHAPRTEGSDEPYCRHCYAPPYGHAPYPCPTVQCITAALEAS